MPCRRLIALADDITGAAEIAAVGHCTGWRAEVQTRWSGWQEDALTVVDADTRLSRPDELWAHGTAAH